jgi:hypothetical protein
MMGTMVEICLFFSNSPKRQLELEKHIPSGKLVYKYVQNTLGSTYRCTRGFLSCCYPNTGSNEKH